MNKYSISCNNCKQRDIVAIDKDNRIFWDGNEFIISGRYRLDGNWGWQCKCGNNSLLSKQEDESITNKQTPDANEIAVLIKKIKVENDNKFRMEKI